MLLEYASWLVTVLSFGTIFCGSWRLLLLQDCALWRKEADHWKRTWYLQLGYPPDVAERMVRSHSGWKGAGRG